MKPLFRHLDGIAMAPIAFELLKKGVLDHIMNKKKVGIKVLSAAFSANENVADLAAAARIHNADIAVIANPDRYQELKTALFGTTITAANLFFQKHDLLAQDPGSHRRADDPFHVVQSLPASRDIANRVAAIDGLVKFF